MFLSIFLLIVGVSLMAYGTVLLCKSLRVKTISELNYRHLFVLVVCALLWLSPFYLFRV